MRTLLRIDSSFSGDLSFSRQATDHYEHLWKRNNPNGRVIYRDLALSQLPHLTREVYEAFNDPKAGIQQLAMSNELIAELEKADEILISSPVYNFAVPSTLKAYIDHILRIDRTFAYDPSTYTRKGLLENTSATIIVARGGLPVNGKSPDGVETYLEGILKFIGVEQLTRFSIHGTTYSGSEESLSKSKRLIENHFKQYDAERTEV
ncbi:FMN-dependent NADH-azoreductase [Flagellimonas olearia]|uniref:FMN dependent NADH:quinone oxidoreductase n=1 Tax=Flagellimonas olearia TaxID=552546 RepID=A0A6I1E2Y5_9FLAO|nr:NAD(P)H-dependent oxidoreductase [Allomuricauda olearia]KAB7530205.1 FMN-dependent NADH-azoreductase [Allomuricauda olearia]